MEIAVADLNGDGLQDLLVACRFQANSDGRLEVYLGGSNATWQHHASYSPGDVPNELNTGDMDGDGDLDVIVVNSGSRERVIAVLANAGDGTLADPITHSRGGFATPNLIVNDADSDGDMDLVLVGNSVNSTRAMLIANEHRGGKIGPFNAYRLDREVDSVKGAHMDVDGDGQLDAIYPNFKHGVVRVYAGGGRGSNDVAVSKDVRRIDGLSRILGAGHLSNAEAPDLIISTQVDPFTTDTRVLSRNEKQEWTVSDPLPGAQNPRIVRVGRFTNPTRTQLLIVSTADSNQDIHLARIFERDPQQITGPFAQVDAIAFEGFPYSLASADIDNDGDLELFRRDLETKTVTVIDG